MTTAMQGDQWALDVDVGPSEMHQFVETHAGADGDGYQFADALRTLDQEVRDLLARPDPRVEGGSLPSN